jgi:hypothetical protein
VTITVEPLTVALIPDVALAEAQGVPKASTSNSTSTRG